MTFPIPDAQLQDWTRVEPLAGGATFALDLTFAGLLGACFEAFGRAGAYGNGAAWSAVLEHRVASDEELDAEALEIQGESDAVRVTSQDRAQLEALAESVRRMVSLEPVLAAAIDAARQAGFGHGDLG